jgi:hypothetical protein
MCFLNADCKTKSVKGDTGWKPMGNCLKKEQIIHEKKQERDARILIAVQWSE